MVLKFHSHPEYLYKILKIVSEKFRPFKTLKNFNFVRNLASDDSKFIKNDLGRLLEKILESIKNQADER